MLQWNKSRLGSPESVRAQLPSCYSSEFDACISEAKRAQEAGTTPRPSPYCDKYYPIIKSASTADWDAAMALMPYCSGGATSPKKDTSGVWPALGIIGVIGGVFALAVNASGSRF